MNIKGALYKDSSRDRFIKRFGKPIETYESFKRSTETVGEVNFKNYRRVLPRYFLYLDQDPDQVIEQRKKDIANHDVTQAENYERKTIAYLKKLDADGLSTGGHTSRIQGFFRNNSKRLALDLGKMGLSKGRKKRKYSPSNEDARKILAKSDNALHRLIFLFLYHTGAAPVDASELRCKDLPREPWQYFEKSRSKTGEVWRGVTTPDLCEQLNIYLNIRGHYLQNDPLFVGREGPLSNTGISQIVNDMITTAGLKKEGFSAKSMRDSFEDALTDAEIYVKTKETLMGHTADIQHVYGSEKKMQDSMVTAMQKVYPLLCVNENNLHTHIDEDGFTSEERALVRKMLKGFFKEEYELVAKRHLDT